VVEYDTYLSVCRRENLLKAKKHFLLGSSYVWKSLIKLSGFLFNQYIPREIYFYSLQRQSTLVIWIITKRIFISFFQFIITSGICWNEKNLLMMKGLTRSFSYWVNDLMCQTQNERRQEKKNDRRLSTYMYVLLKRSRLRMPGTLLYRSSLTYIILLWHSQTY